MYAIRSYYAAQEICNRTLYFPKQTEYVDTFPAKENVWIFIMAGQSNMAGRGFVEPGDTLPDPRIITLDKSNNWVYAKEPLHYYTPELSGLDCGMSFASVITSYSIHYTKLYDT